MVSGIPSHLKTRDKAWQALSLCFIPWACAHPKDVENTWAILLCCWDTDPGNIVLLNMICNMYCIIQLLVGKPWERGRLRYVLTPCCAIMPNMHFASSSRIIHRVAKVWGLIGAVLCKQICPFGLVSMLDIWTCVLKMLPWKHNRSYHHQWHQLGQWSGKNLIYKLNCRCVPSRQHYEQCCQSSWSLPPLAPHRGRWSGPRSISLRSGVAAYKHHYSTHQVLESAHKVTKSQ